MPRPERWWGWERSRGGGGRGGGGGGGAGGGGGVANAHAVERVVGADRALERGYLRPRGRCHRQPGEPLAVDVDRRVRRDQARGGRCGRVRGRPAGARPPR